MLTYRMDLTNFVQGARAGARITTGEGLKTDFTEFSPDADTLGLWHLHDGACQGEGTGLEDASGGGRPLVNHGAAAQEDGYRFVRGESDYMAASFAGQPERSKMTIETWVRGWAVPVGSGGFVLYFNGPRFLCIWAQRATSPSASMIRAWSWPYAATWTGTEVDALLAGAEPWHVAAVLDAPSSLRLFVNGLQRAQGICPPEALPAGDYALYLGTYWGYTGYELDAVLDEVRLSGSARYTATFPVPRLLTAGMYTGLTFDSGRPGAVWAGLPSDHVLPQGTALTWETRAADATDGAGEPQAPWQAYDGTPSALPRGRYFQWRATLASSPDRLLSPTLESVDALASDAGYTIYHATGASPDLLDHGEPWGCTGPGVTQLAAGPLEAPAVHWFSIRPVDSREVESPIAQGEVRLELDSQGQPAPDRPAGVLAVSAHPLPGGRAQVTWSYRVGLSGVLPQVFRIFGDGGSGNINYATPLGETPYRASEASYGWTSDPLTGSGEHQLAVRAITADGVWDEQPAVARVTPDLAAPGEVDNLKAEVIL